MKGPIIAKIPVRQRQCDFRQRNGVGGDLPKIFRKTSAEYRPQEHLHVLGIFLIARPEDERTGNAQKLPLPLRFFAKLYFRIVFEAVEEQIFESIMERPAPAGFDLRRGRIEMIDIGAAQPRIVAPGGRSAVDQRHHQQTRDLDGATGKDNPVRGNRGFTPS